MMVWVTFYAPLGPRVLAMQLPTIGMAISTVQLIKIHIKFSSLRVVSWTPFLLERLSLHPRFRLPRTVQKELLQCLMEAHLKRIVLVNRIATLSSSMLKETPLIVRAISLNSRVILRAPVG